MKIENDLLLLMLILPGILIFSFAAGCISGEFSIEENITQENLTLSGDLTSSSPVISAVKSADSDSKEIETISVKQTPVETINDEDMNNIQYIPLWDAGTVVSDIDKESYCLITKVIPDTSEYCIKNVIYPPESSPYIYKDTTLGGWGKNYPSSSIDKKYPVFVGIAIKMVVHAEGSSTKIVGYYENNTKESMTVKWTSKYKD